MAASDFMDFSTDPEQFSLANYLARAVLVSGHFES